MNKKILGATMIEYNGIKFRSKLECSCYKLLEESGLDFSYESEKITLWEGSKLTKTQVYAPKKLGAGKYGKVLELQTKALISTTYTPDFVIRLGKYKVYLETKGMPNEQFALKKKMFLKSIENRDDNKKYLFIEPHNIKQMKQAIEIIKSL